jgi:hypothetical protein
VKCFLSQSPLSASEEYRAILANAGGSTWSCGFEPRSRLERVRISHQSCRQLTMACGECRRNYINLLVLGSNPGHAATQASSMDRASENVSPPNCRRRFTCSGHGTQACGECRRNYIRLRLSRLESGARVESAVVQLPGRRNPARELFLHLLSPHILIRGVVHCGECRRNYIGPRFESGQLLWSRL